MWSPISKDNAAPQVTLQQLSSKTAEVLDEVEHSYCAML